MPPALPPRILVTLQDHAAQDNAEQKPCAAALHTPAEQPLFLPATREQSIAQAIYLSGKLAPVPLCNGMGQCGRCRVRYVCEPEANLPLAAIPLPTPEDTATLSSDMLAQGWRLGCQHVATGTHLVELPPNSRVLANTAQPCSPPPCPTSEALALPTQGPAQKPVHPLASPRTEPLFLGVDLGTTSLHWAVCTGSGTILHQESQLNPQAGAGSDCISRLAYAATPQGRETLYHITLHALQAIAARANAFGSITSLCLAANPSMTALALHAPTSGLATAPYSLEEPGGRGTSLPGLPPVWLPPQFAPFVGGDIGAGLAAILAKNPQYPFLLADLGTNGEFLLALAPETMLCASVALGPALEGIGLRFGTEARPGAISRFSLRPTGLHAHPLEQGQGMEATAHTTPGMPGITGTGYLSLMRCLLQAKAMGEDGHFTREQSPMLRRSLAAPVVPCPCPLCHNAPIPPLPATPYLPLPHGMFVSARDVEELLKVKAAFSLGLSLLLQEAGIPSHALQAVYLAGALGLHAEKEALEALGFFPQGTATRMHVLGNASLQGACLLAHSAPARKAVLAAASHVTPLTLAERPSFMQGFAQHMRFAW